MRTGRDRSAEVQGAEEKEDCILCGKMTEVGKEQPISKREHYIEGAGQLCQECYRKLYVPRHNENRVQL